ncbi:MAG TPA: LysE family translocator [Steroidobacteraceae bacterium]|jgi:threonine/homoserine/homoserine lactone efflux protein|nr:LysE family translocator [Steroidobacteraceae bacterium]
MSWYGLATFCAAYFLAVATPGPGVAAIIAQSLARGSKGAVAFIAGFLVGDLMWFCAAALGLATLAHTAHTAFLVVRYVGALYLLYLAYKLWTAPARPLAEAHADALARPPHALFLGSLTLTLSNPKPMLFFLALLPTVVPLESLSAFGQAQIAAAIVVILPLTLGAYVFIAARARAWLRNPKAIKLLNRGSGTVMAAAAVAVATR